MTPSLAPAALLLLLAVPPPAAPAEAEPQPLDLSAAVALALARNPALQSAEERRRELLGGVQEVRADAYPQLTAISDWNRSRNPSLLNSADFQDLVDAFPGGSFTPQEQELYRVSLELSQPLYTWGKVGTAIRLAETLLQATEAQIETARLDTALAAAEAYYRLLSARRAAGTLEVQRQLRQELLAEVEARYEIGEATRLELLRSRASLAEVEPEAARVQGEVEIATSELRRALGLDAGEPLAVADASQALAAPPELAELLTRAQRQRPELRDLQLQQQALSQRQTVVRADAKPSLDLNGAYGHSARLVENLDDGLYRDWSVTVTLRWELLDGGRRRGQVAQLESQRQQLAWQQQDLSHRIHLEIEQALAGYRSSRARWLAAQAAAEAAREARRVAAETYREGVALQSDLLDAQEQETQAELLEVQAYYDGLTEWARLHRAVGRLPAAPEPETKP